MNTMTASGVQFQRSSTLGKKRKINWSQQGSATVRQNSGWGSLSKYMLVCGPIVNKMQSGFCCPGGEKASAYYVGFSDFPICQLKSMYEYLMRPLPRSTIWHWEGFQPTVIMSDCTTSWHIPVGCGNNYLSIPRSTTDLIMIMTFPASIFTTCRPISFTLRCLWSWE